MNVIFVDFDGTLCTEHGHTIEDIERKIKILAEVCHKYDCKVVVEAAAKETIDEETMTSDMDWVQNILDLFKKHKIECIGRTPSSSKEIAEGIFVDLWKEDEIIEYLKAHPEIEHFCVIDDDDLQPKDSDLNKVRDYLVTPLFFSDNPDEEGLQPYHKDEIGMILKRSNRFK